MAPNRTSQVRSDGPLAVLHSSSLCSRKAIFAYYPGKSSSKQAGEHARKLAVLEEEKKNNTFSESLRIEATITVVLPAVELVTLQKKASLGESTLTKQTIDTSARGRRSGATTVKNSSSHSQRRLSTMLCGLVVLVSLATTGCQMDIAGQTLPSPYYLTDDVQYYAPGPEFKLAREAAALKEQSAKQISEPQP